METFDAIILGSGQSGNPLAMALVKAGWKTAMVEEKHVGGTCINEGCTPSKTIYASAKAAYIVKRAADFGIQTGPVSIDMLKVRQRKQGVVDSFRNSSQSRIEQAGIDLILGKASFTGLKTLEIGLNAGGKRELTAENIFINAGGRPRALNVEGLEEVPTLNSTSIMELDEVPEYLVILGGGTVAVEFSQMFRRFGSQVTILQRSGQLLTAEDKDVADAVAQILVEDGIEVLLNTQVQRVDCDAQGKKRLVMITPQDERTIVGTHLLVAAGRVPNTDDLNLAATGVETDPRGYIRVNDRLETNVKGIYAMGDVNGGPNLTNISYNDFRVLKANLLGDGQGTIRGRFVPYTVFIDPQLGRVGMTEKQAREQGLEIQVAKMPMDYIARAVESSQARGMIKAIVDAKTKQILGVSVLGMEGGEMMAFFEIAMMGKLPYTTLRDGIFSHPTLAEGLNTLFAQLDGDQSPGPSMPGWLSSREAQHA